MNAIAHIHIETPWLAEERFVAGGTAAVAVASELFLGIRLRFHNHAPEPLAIGLPFHQQAADELGSDLLGRAAEEGLGEGWKLLGGRDGYGSGLGGDGWRLLGGQGIMRSAHKADPGRRKRMLERHKTRKQPLERAMNHETAV
jgi:hypothetical protein